MSETPDETLTAIHEFLKTAHGTSDAHA
jgi:hypothetical protein